MIPARMGSEGFKFKNRKFFGYTADFIAGVPWLERRIVSTDDPAIAEAARACGAEVPFLRPAELARDDSPEWLAWRHAVDALETHARPAELAGPAVSIHRVFGSVIADMGVPDDAVLWLFYLPILFKNIKHFEYAKECMESGAHESFCTFVPARTHPYNCWKYDPEAKRLEQYVENDCFRRQDLPPAWVHYHYVYCFRAGALASLNSEMINAATFPLFLSESVRNKLIEIDTPEDYECWKAAGSPMGGDDD